MRILCAVIVPMGADAVRGRRCEMKHKRVISWGFIVEAIILGLFIGIGIENCGKHIGKGISEIKITVITGGAK